ncbi:MAG: flagellin [Fretibacterium sp.]
MVVNNNIPALFTYNTVTKTGNALQKSIQKLSTGLRINSAADDAAGLAISEKMRAQVRGLDRAVSNSQDGISMIQTAEGALNETHSILQRMRELSVQSANDTLTQQDRGYIQLEIDQLREEITRIGNTTQFNKKKLLNGDAAVLWSSDNLNTKAIINGGLRQVDQFGQKKALEGNYKIRIKAEAGQGEVRKSDIFKIKHDISSKDSLKWDIKVGAGTGFAAVATQVAPKDLPVADYKVSATTAGAVTTATASEVARSGTGAGAVTMGFAASQGTKSGLVTYEILSNDGTKAKVKYTTVAMGKDGSTVKLEGTTELVFGVAKAVDVGFGTSNVTLSGAQDAYKVGDKITMNVVGESAATDSIMTVSGGALKDHKFVVTSAAAAHKKEIDFALAYKDGSDLKSGALKVKMEGAITNNASITFKPIVEAPVKWAVDSLQNGATGLKLEGLQAGSVAIASGNATADANAAVTQLFKTGAGTAALTVAPDAPAIADLNYNAILKFKYVGNNKFEYSGTIVDKSGNATKIDKGTFELTADATDTVVNMGLLGTIKVQADALANLREGDVYVHNITANQKQDVDSVVTVSSGNGMPDHKFVLTKAAVANKDVFLPLAYALNGVVKDGSATLSMGGALTDGDVAKARGLFDMSSNVGSSIGKVATSDVKLADLEKFWDAQGRFMIADPQTITITQGDGKQAKVTLYKDDTLGSMAEKLNKAIAMNLGQGKYVDDSTKFVTFVDKETDDDTSESAKGTFVIRTVVPGSTGRINFAGDEDVIKALSLNTIQDAKETNYTVNITDAHTGATVLEDTKVTGNRLIGALHPNVDVEFDAMAGITASWNDKTKAFDSRTVDYDTVLHLADNTTVFQIGANEGEDMGINIGDMRAHALGLNAVLVTDRESAARSITIIDNAIDKVSTQRAKLGAYQNRLEHTINNLTVAGENLTSAESRIRDTDMAKEMMNFTKLNIMLQAGNAMLAQANQLPQGVLSLIR